VEHFSGESVRGPALLLLYAHNLHDPVHEFEEPMMPLSMTWEARGFVCMRLPLLIV